MAVQLDGLRQQVDPHWRRGISSLKRGLRWLKGVIHKNRPLFPPVPFFSLVRAQRSRILKYSKGTPNVMRFTGRQ